MKLVFALSFLLALAAAVEKYTTENDDFDIDAAVADTDKLKSLVGCFLDTVTCSSPGADFKKDIPEAYRTACLKCTAAQKTIFRKFLEGLKAKLPADYEAFMNKYDPEGKYSPALDVAIGASY